MDNEVMNTLLKLISESMPNVDMKGVNENTRFIEDLRYDSLGLFTLVINVEKAFNVSFKETYQINTVKDIYDFVISHKK